MRAQIPLLIALKNSIICFRHRSGYGINISDSVDSLINFNSLYSLIAGVFIDFFVFSFLISIALICVLSLVRFRSTVGVFLLSIIVIVILGGSLYLLGHMRVAFKEKYKNQIPFLLH